MNKVMKQNNNLRQQLTSHFPWLLLGLLGAFALGVIALRRGEPINALWLVTASVGIYLAAYRYYALFIAGRVLGIDPTRATPAVLNNDGLDYVPTNRHVLFGHHFAAIAGAAARHTLADCRRRARRCGAGLYRAVFLQPPQCTLARRHGA